MHIFDPFLFITFIMKALVLSSLNTYPCLTEVKEEQMKGKIKVDLKASAINHRDIWICKGMYPGIRYPIILGSDGVGVYQDRDVLINPNINWGSIEAYQGLAYNILGLPENGTFAEFIWVGKDRLIEKPSHLSLEEAAALPLAGMTAYRALFSKAAVSRDELVFISGIGGGVALFALQFALAAGIKVIVSSGSQEKIDKAIRMGAYGGVLYNDENFIGKLKELAQNGIDVIIDGAGGANLSSLMNLVNYGGRIVVYGGTSGKIPSLNPQLIFWKQLKILGSTMGSDRDFTDMIGFVNKHKIRPVVDSIFTFKESEQAFDYVDKHQQFGKVVFKNV